MKMKILHLFLKESLLFNGVSSFLHLFLRCAMKTHSEGVAESMGNYVEMHAEKRRGSMDIEDVGKETFIHWNGPPVHLSEKLGIKTMDRIFKGKNWNFVTRKNRLDSLVVKKAKKETPRLPWF